MSKRVRFGVFKRDSFTCQYCGAAAPNVQLHVDHIVPVSGGGSDDPDNLVTACAACNFGKGARTLRDEGRQRSPGPEDPADRDPLPDDVEIANEGESDHSARRAEGAEGGADEFESRQDQSQAIEDRRAQLAMMIEWREEIVGLQDEAVDALDRRVFALSGLSLNEEHRQRMRRWVRHYGFTAVYEAVEDGLDQMLEWRDGVVMIASWERAIAAIPQIIELRRAARDKPHFHELVYICGLLRRRLQYVNELRCLRLMEDGVEAGASIEAMKAFARTVTSWTAFRSGLEEFISEYSGSDHPLGANAGSNPAKQGEETDPPGAVLSGGKDDRTIVARAPLAADRPGMPETFFERRRPLRHFSPDGSMDTVGLGEHSPPPEEPRHRSR